MNTIFLEFYKVVNYLIKEQWFINFKEIKYVEIDFNPY